MNAATPIVRDVVLLGGGHSHVIVIRKWGMKPVPGVQLTLVSESGMTPYSGMLPGLVAGHYDFAESHIDLNRLCRWSGVRFVRDRVEGIDPDQDSVQLEDRPSLGYDILSIDTGGAPRLDVVEGAREFTTPVKPVANFWARWRKIERRARETPGPLQIGVVGGGAGGFEILLAMQYRLADRNSSMAHGFHWFCRGGVLPGATRRVQRLARQACLDRGVTLHEGFDVSRVSNTAVHGASGDMQELDEVLWCTEATAAKWPAASGIDCDDQGFIRLNDALQSVSHPKVFAAGDVAIQINHPRPRAGVFAVRQGTPLFENLQRAAVGEPLRPYKPQSRFLTLLSLGEKRAIARRGFLSVQGQWVWRWKDWIDRRFMNRFNALPAKPVMVQRPLPPSLAEQLQYDEAEMRCGGCGAKVAGDVLASALDALEVISRDDVISGFANRDDTALINPGGRQLAQSVDQLKVMLDDPWLFARVAAQHALSDLYASGATPQSAMLIVGLPFASEAVTARQLKLLLEGVVSTLNESGCALIGGHTSETAELTIGLVVNGYPAPPVVRSETDLYTLILSKPLGTGVIMAADMRGLAPWHVVEPCIENMLASNAAAGGILADHGAMLTTDVTGFGLIGHLQSMLCNTPGRTRLFLDAVPLLPGAAALSGKGIRSSLYPANLRSARHVVYEDAGIVNRPGFEILLDPQTSGGLIGLVPSERARACLDALHQAGLAGAAAIGSTVFNHDDAQHSTGGVVHVCQNSSAI